VNKLLQLVRRSRNARKEAALVRLASAQRLLGDAIAASASATAEFEAAQGWREDFLRRNGAGLNHDWRHTMLPSCNAVIHQRRLAAMEAFSGIAKHRLAVAQSRAALSACEKALLRTDELETQVKDAAKEHARLAEQSQDDDLAITRGGAYPMTRGVPAWT
jgi:hypothetical protein